MNDILRFALIIGALLLVYYFVNNNVSLVPNAGSVSEYVPAALAQPAETTMDMSDRYETDGYETDGYETSAIPIESPKTSLGGSFDHLNWDGLGENQVQGALSKQYQDLTGEDLLPHNDIAQFSEVYPDGVGQLQNKSFLHSGHHVGINTVAQANKNASYDLRSTPANSQLAVSPWLNSSIGPDLMRRPFEIGGCE
jgi:hypothetical protein